MKKRLLSVFIIFFVISASLPSYALGKVGHRVLCQLSYDLLPKSQQNKIDQLLQQLPQLEKQRINQYNYIKKEQPVSFANSCTWADAIKKDDSYNEFKSWHYLNVDRKTEHITKESCQKNCLTTAISYHTQQLSTDENNIKKAKALMFLGHWLGDIHQPLHVSFASDLGGNKLDIKPYIGRCNNMHWYWDQCLLMNRDKNKGEKTSHYYQGIYRQLYQQLSQDLAKAPKLAWQNSDVLSWANESLTLVRKSNFNYCQINNNNNNNNNNNKCESYTGEKILLSQEYHQKFSQILQQRILQGATRLTMLLNTAL